SSKAGSSWSLTWMQRSAPRVLWGSMRRWTTDEVVAEEGSRRDLRTREISGNETVPMDRQQEDHGPRPRGPLRCTRRDARSTRGDPIARGGEQPDGGDRRRGAGQYAVRHDAGRDPR